MILVSMKRHFFNLVEKIVNWRFLKKRSLTSLRLDISYTSCCLPKFHGLSLAERVIILSERCICIVIDLARVTVRGTAQ